MEFIRDNFEYRVHWKYQKINPKEGSCFPMKCNICNTIFDSVYPYKNMELKKTYVREWVDISTEACTSTQVINKHDITVFVAICPDCECETVIGYNKPGTFTTGDIVKSNNCLH